MDDRIIVVLIAGVLVGAAMFWWIHLRRKSTTPLEYPAWIMSRIISEDGLTGAATGANKPFQPDLKTGAWSRQLKTNERILKRLGALEDETGRVALRCRLRQATELVERMEEALARMNCILEAIQSPPMGPVITGSLSDAPAQVNTAQTTQLSSPSDQPTTAAGVAVPNSEFAVR